MPSISNDYAEFLLWLDGQEASPDVCRLANIIKQSIGDLVPLRTHGSKRSIALIAEAVAQWESTETTLAEPVEKSNDDKVEWKTLETLTLGPFRGFRKEETLELAKPITLIYGANGAGKSSLFEALEYSLLGKAYEADEKRIKDDKYYTNTWTGTFVPPTITGKNTAGELITISANEELNRFCFVEKNRIDEFSRITSRARSKQEKSIATLFGIESFAEFVKGFSPKLDSKLDLKGEQGEALKEKRQSLSLAEQTIERYTEQLSEWNAKEEEIAKSFKGSTDLGFAEVQTHIGSIERPGRIEELETLLAKAPSPQIGINPSLIKSSLSSIAVQDNCIQDAQTQLDKLSSKVNFKKLYTAVLELATESPEQCPACETSLSGDSSVVANPYDKATSELAGLSELSKLEDTISGAEGIIQSIESALRTELSKLPEDIVHFDQTDWWRPLLDEDSELHKGMQTAISAIELLDEKSREDAQSRATLRAERTHLQDIQREITLLAGLKQVGLQQKDDAESQIATFDADNKELIQAANDENDGVVLNNKIKKAYDAFMPLLESYLAELPGKLMANLGDKTLELYNAINHHDEDCDKLATLSLPTEPNEKIRISLIGSDEVFHNALHFLSEGHIRCLGLAILLAKNIQQNCPVLILDDIVNAIDEDHRSGIIQTLFRDNHLDGKQLILTCHGKEFISAIQQQLGASRTQDNCNYYELLQHKENYHPDLRKTPKTKNYVLLAQQDLDNEDYREALSNARKGLEYQTQELWKWRSKRNRGDLSVKLSCYDDRTPGLRNLCEVLNKDIKKITPADDCCLGILEVLESLLGIGGQSQEWTYLNKGTHHEDRGEFDRTTVGIVVEAITKLDSHLLSRG